jgi:hypothetical protein
MHRLFLGLLLPVISSAQFSARESAQTDAAFDKYVGSAEASMDWRATQAAEKVTLFTANGKSPHPVTDGMIHDWSAAVFVPKAKIERAIEVFQNYAAYKNVFAPEVVESKLLEKNNNHWKAFLRLKRKKVLTAVLNSEYDVEYRPLGDGRWAILSRSTKMSEVDGERELPPGEGHGYLWRLNAYWLLESRPGGLYMECRSISLTRDVPRGLGWAIGPIVANLPKESLQATVEAAARAAVQ